MLAAGVSRRFGGEPKLLRELAGESLVRRAVKTALASRLGEVVVVLGHAAPAVGEAVADLDVHRVINPQFELGQSTSVRAGLARIAPGSTAALFIPADQPLLTTRLIDRLLAAYAATGGPIVAPVFEGRRGAPTLFDRSLFFELERLEGDTGGRRVLPRYPDSIVEVEATALELADIDTEDDLRRLARQGW